MKRLRKLDLARKLAAYSGRSAVQVQLDRLWGFKPVPLERQKKRRKKLKRSLVTQETAEDRAVEALASLDALKEPVPEEKKHNDASVTSKDTAKNHKPWEPEPLVQKERQLFKDTVKELHELVYPHLDPIAKRQYDQAKLMALGGKIAKNRKMPYNEFSQRSRALKRNVEKNKELEKQLGVKLFMDTKGGARFVEIEKRKRKREFKDSQTPFDFGGNDGVYRIKQRTNR